MRYFIILCFIFCSSINCFSQIEIQKYSDITTGAQQTKLYLPLLKNKKVAIVTNASGIIGNKHLVDTLLKLKVKIVKIFGPEHGFRGTADAGEKVKSGKDSKTGIPVVSLYGSHKKPTKDDFKGVDIILYDIQDIGVRFYTYISTMTYVMEACAEHHKELIILDRPNPNGFYIDGPVMMDKYKSFLGLHNVPIVYGMTCGEYAQMVNGELWLKGAIKCKLTVVSLLNYNRKKITIGLPVNPSPNITTDTAIVFYPTLGLFEGTIVSLGRGTRLPFQYIGSPFVIKNKFTFSFTPKSTAISKRPKYQDTLCEGVNLGDKFASHLTKKELDLSLLSLFYNATTQNKEVFFDKNFNYHAGNDELQQQISNQLSEEQIRASWQPTLSEFKKIRSKYLIYSDF